MKKACLIVLLIGKCLPVCIAQKADIPAYFFTKKSERFFSDKEFDEMFYKASLEAFEFNKVPSSVLDKQYQKIKPRLIALSRPKIVQQFKSVEFYNETRAMSEEGSKSYLSVKNEYTKFFYREIEQAFLNNKELKKYLGFNTSDRITYFNSQVKVQPNGKLWVTETITIYNGNGENGPNEDTALTQAGGNNNEIKRGIVRTFPVVYTGKYQFFYNTTFSLKDVQLVGEKNVNWQLKTNQNGYNLYIGSPDYYLPEGLYTYVITYETDHQLKLLKKFDEIVWNVTGNGWNFRIDSAACTILLPDGASLLSNACYTGILHSKASDCIKNSEGDSITFKTNRPLKPNEGLTVATSWRKGTIQSQDTFLYLWWMFKNNQAVFLLPLLALLFGIYNFIVWLLVGKDPKPETIFPQFYPLKKLSPAAMGFIYNHGFNNKLLAATITDWAARNLIRIEVEREGFIFKNNAYEILESSGAKKPADYEDFSGNIDRIVHTTIAKGKYNSGLGAIKHTIESSLDTTYKATKQNNLNGFFILNNWYMAPGNLLTVLGFFYVCFGVLTRPGSQNVWHFGYLLAGLTICILVQVFFYRIIKTYTREGRKVMDAIEGFRMFLVAADEQRFNLMNPPAKTIELYEAYLPFAIALDCEIEWSKRFADIIETSSIDPTSGTAVMHSSLRTVDYSSAFTDNFSGAISSASTPPSSSSGGGSTSGGGSSGSGGGGGGGGGW